MTWSASRWRVSYLLTLLSPKLIKGGREKIGASEQGWIKLLLWLMPILNFQDPGHMDQTPATSHGLSLLVRSTSISFFPIIFLISLGLK